MNKIDLLFKTKKNKIISIYFPAGYPLLNATNRNINLCLNSGIDMIEIGIPFSDPLADGPVIQMAHYKALNNGMNVEILFHQLSKMDFTKSKIPILLMGYWNSIYQYGVGNFVKKCVNLAISGVIIPDLTLEEYVSNYKKMFENNNVYNILLVSPNTSTNRLKFIKQNAKGFIYMVSMPSTTGSEVLKKDFDNQTSYFKRVTSFNLPTLIGFGISNKDKFDTACVHANGAIIGTAFIQALENKTEDEFLLQFKDKL